MNANGCKVLTPNINAIPSPETDLSQELSVFRTLQQKNKKDVQLFVELILQFFCFVVSE